MQATLTDLTKKLLSFRSTASRPEEIKRCFDFVQDYLNSGNIPTERLIFNNKLSLYVGTTPKPPVLLCGHLDVVEGDDTQFTPRLDGDKLFGRGSLDMKSGAAVLIEYTKNHFANNKNFGLLLTSDEEVGGFDGVGSMQKNGYGATTAVLLPDGSKNQNSIVTKEKGIIWLVFTATGVAAHGSTPWRGANAIAVLTQFLSQLDSLFLPHVSHPDNHWVTTGNIGKIQGGTTTNQVADKATAHYDIRYTEHDTPEEIIKRIKNICPPNIFIDILLNEPVVTADTANEAITQYCEAIRTITKKEPEFIVEHGSSDARFFTDPKIPVIISEPTGDGLHGANEWVSVSSIVEYYRIVENFMERV